MRTSIFILALHALLIGSCNAEVGSLRNVQVLGNVVRFELINGITQRRIRDLHHKAVIDISTIPGMVDPIFNVRAVLSGGASVVVFDHQTTYNFHYDYTSPYTLCSTASCPVLGFGTHTIRATTYSSTSLTTAGKRLMIDFEIRRTNPPVQAVTSLQLINAGISPNNVVMDLKYGTTNLVDLGRLGLSDARFNIQAVPGSNIQSVKFNNGVVESSSPLAYCGNDNDKYNICDDLVVGTRMNITVTGYPSAGASGTPYPLQWAVIQITKPTSTVPVGAPIAAPKAVPVAAPKAVPVAAPISPVAAPKALPNAIPIIPPVAVPQTQRACAIPKLSDNMWWSTPSAPYPISVAESQGSMIGNDFVIFSGFKDGYSMATTETYALDMSVASATWKRMDDMPFSKGLTHLGIAVNGMKAYLCGGYVGGSLGTHDGSCFIYDHSKTSGSGQQWSTFDPLPNGGRSGGGMIYDTALNALVYTAGSQRPIAGQNSAIDYIDTWMYSLNNPSAGWVSKTNIPFHGNHMNFVTAFDIAGRERHYFFGGQLADEEERGNTATMYEYVATTDTWIQRAPMPFPRGHSAAASRAIGCGFIVAGGRTNTGLTNDVTYYDIPTNTWRSIGILPVEIHTNVCVIYNGVLRCETGWAQGSFTAQRPIVL